MFKGRLDVAGVKVMSCAMRRADLFLSLWRNLRARSSICLLIKMFLKL